MSRRYAIPFQNLGLSTNKQDMWAVKAGSSIPFILEEIRLDPCASSVSEFALSLNLFQNGTGTYTAGTGGAGITASPRVASDIAFHGTAVLQNTLQTVAGTGTKTVEDVGSWNLVNGWWWQPLDPDHRVSVPVGATLVVSLDTAPASQTVSGNVIVREDY